MNIRFAKKSDLDFLIFGLEENRIIEKRLKKDIPARKSDIADFQKGIKEKTILIAEDKGASVGFLYFRPDFKVMYLNENFFWVDLVFVKKDSRHKGIGKALYKKAFNLAKELGLKKVVLDVFEANINSRAFHNKLGFKPLYAIYEKEL